MFFSCREPVQQKTVDPVLLKAVGENYNFYVRESTLFQDSSISLLPILTSPSKIELEASKIEDSIFKKIKLINPNETTVFIQNILFSNRLISTDFEPQILLAKDTIEVGVGFKFGAQDSTLMEYMLIINSSSLPEKKVEISGFIR